MGFLKSGAKRRVPFLGRLGDYALLSHTAVRLANSKGWVSDSMAKKLGARPHDNKQALTASEAALAGAAVFRMARRRHQRKKK